MNVYCQLDPNSPGLKLLLEIQRRMADKPLTLKKLAVEMRSSVIKNFEPGFGRPPSLPWRPRVATSTERKILAKRQTKKRGGGTWKLLVHTGRLWRSIRPRVTGEYAEVFTDVVYAATHNYGDPRRNIPQRRFMCIPDNEQEEMAEKLLGYVATGQWKKAPKVIR